MNAASTVATDSAATSQQSKSTSGLSSEAPSKDMFLKLLVAQIKNQDPLNPTDGVQFLSQLAQFSQLEQLVDIRSGIDVLAGTVQGSIETGESA
jgi:flagellar basal-body rod modification protein FlgD